MLECPFYASFRCGGGWCLPTWGLSAWELADIRGPHMDASCAWQRPGIILTDEQGNWWCLCTLPVLCLGVLVLLYYIVRIQRYFCSCRDILLFPLLAKIVSYRGIWTNVNCLWGLVLSQVHKLRMCCNALVCLGSICAECILLCLPWYAHLSINKWTNEYIDIYIYIRISIHLHVLWYTRTYTYNLYTLVSWSS